MCFIRAILHLMALFVTCSFAKKQHGVDPIKSPEREKAASEDSAFYSNLRKDLFSTIKNQLMKEARLFGGHEDGHGRKTRTLSETFEAKAGAVMYLPLSNAGSIRCPTSADAAAVSLTQMTFLATAMNIFSVVANISNNLNNNNNNNNKVSFNIQSNNNVVTNTNVNNGNQVNVMVPVIVLP